MADAEKLKKKLHGSILKGTKVRIEKARPAKEIVVEEDPEPEAPKKERRKRGPSEEKEKLAGGSWVPGCPSSG